MSEYNKSGITRIIIGAVLVGVSGVFSGHSGNTLGMMGRHGGLSLWKLVLLGIGIGFFARGVSSFFSGYSRFVKKGKNAKARRINEETSILRVARENKGIVTVAKTALVLGHSLEETEKILNDLVSKGHATMEINDEGRIYYLFSDFAER